MPLRPEDIPPATVRALERGERETANLAESLAMDLRPLARLVAPDLSKPQLARIAPNIPYTKRMRDGASMLAEHLGHDIRTSLALHPSDTVRGWACFMVGSAPGMTLRKRLAGIKPLADDPHFGVREYAWLAVRQPIIDDLDTAIDTLEPWTRARSANIRRFATEATRPRGVWCTHIRALRADPSRAAGLLEPLRDDPSKYVQDSVANWLNDASKDQPDWVIDLTDRWLTETDSPRTARIVKRARRTLTRNG